MAPHDVTGEHTFRVGATFGDTPDTHYYGLGQYQDGVLDLRGRTIDCRHDYDRPAGEAVCVPFMVTDKGYAILWDNPSATMVSPGLHSQTHLQSNVGERVSFFVIAGRTSDDLYAGYARLTGATPLPPGVTGPAATVGTACAGAGNDTGHVAGCGASGRATAVARLHAD
jgi:alpha-D-xyloside xylohydrolase